MKIKPKEITRTVGILTDPNPTWMAVVDHGANQTPFNSVKRDQIAPKTSAKDKTPMAIKSGKGAKRKSVIQRLTFSKSQFKTEKAVKAYLEENDFAEYKIEDSDDVWTVKSTEDTSHLKLEKTLSTGTKTAGVTAFVAAIKEDTSDDADGDDDEDEDGDDTDASSDDDEEGEDEDEATPASKAARAKAKSINPTETASKRKGLKLKAPKSAAAEPEDGDDEEGEEVTAALEFPPDQQGTVKYDFWSSYMSSEQSLTGVLKDGIGYDGIPPGVEEVMSAVFYSAGNILGDDDSDIATKKQKLEAVGSDFAALTIGLYELFEKATGVADKSATAKAFSESFAASIERAKALILSDNVIQDPADDEEEEAPAPAAKGANKAPAKKNDEQAPAWAVALAAKADRAEAAAKAATARAERAEKALNRQPTRKSFSDSADLLIDQESLSKKQAEDQEERQKRVRQDFGGMFGRVDN